MDAHKGYTAQTNMSRTEAWFLLQQALQNMEASAAKSGRVVPFESLISNSDGIRLHALGVRL